MFYKARSLWHHFLDENEVKTYIKRTENIKFAHLSNVFSPPFLQSHITLHLSLLKIIAHFAFSITRKCMNISRQYVVNMQQNLLQYAPKWTAICTKTDCILHQNGLHFAPKRNSICCKLPYFGVDLWSISEINWFRMCI